MKGSDCLVLDLGTSPGVVHFVRDTLVGRVSTNGLTPAQLQDCIIQPDAELGTLIVPVIEGGDLAPVARAVARCRQQGGHIAVMGVTASSAQAAQMPLGDLFDTLISMDWAAAPDMMRRFVDGQRTNVQNRAFKAFLDGSVDGYWLWHVKRDVVEWSRRTSEMVGLPHEQAPTRRADIAALVHPHDLDRVQQAARNHLEYDAPYKDIEMRMRKGDGRYGHFLASGQTLRDEEGNPIIFVGSLTDRTLMQQVERQLEDTQHRYSVLFHHMNDAAILAESETGTIIAANQPAERLWGKSISELVGAHQSTLHPARKGAEVQQGFAEHVAALMRNRRDSTHALVVRADGTEVPTEISSSLIELDGRTVILGVFRDISDRLRAERDIRERDAQIQLTSHMASMGTLAAGVAHEINNPLTYVLGNLERVTTLLAQDGSTTPEIAQALEAARIGGHYVREIVADLKSISRIDGAEEACDPAEVIRIATRMAMSDLRHRAQLDLALGQVPRVPIAPGRLSQVMLNLLSNAAQAFQSEDRGQNRIGIEVAVADGRVQIVVEDNGVGIPADDLARLFEPFFTRRGESGGTGLGLPICQRILSQADGTLDVSSAPGKGTRVTITLPVLTGQGPVQATSDQPDMTVAAAKPRLIVVDDDTLVTSLLSKILEDAFDISVFNDPRSALDALHKGKPCDVVLCDIMMPQMDGAAFCKALGPQGPPLLYLTGGGVTAQSIAFERRMANEGRLMHKPFDIAELRRKLLHMARGTAGATGGLPSAGPASQDDGAGQPEAAILQELKELLGHDGLCGQMRALGAQLRRLADTSADMTPEALAEEAHRVAGAADVLGLRSVGGALRQCQQAATEGDLPGALAAIDAIRPMRRAFEAFVAGYCADGSGNSDGPRA